MAKARFPLSEEKAAFLSYQARVKQDEEARDQEPLYALLSIDDGYAQHLRDGIAVKLGDVALYELVGHRIDHVVMSGRPLLRKLGNDESMPKAVMSTACVLRSSR
jgi:hypothetical protein